MAVKYLGKRYGIKDVSKQFKTGFYCLDIFLQLKTWREVMKEADYNKDGRLTYLEFQDAVKISQKKMMESGAM